MTAQKSALRKPDPLPILDVLDRLSRAVMTFRSPGEVDALAAEARTALHTYYEQATDNLLTDENDNAAAIVAIETALGRKIWPAE